jgi:RND superfamily putative drug exporter
MFARFARFISRYWVLVLVAWIALAVGFRLAAPRWDEVTQDGDFAYLPKTLPSVIGDELMQDAFPELTAKSSVVLVVARPDGRITAADVAVVARLAEMFKPAKGEKSPVHEIMSYRPDDVVGRKLVSRYDPKKGQAALVILQLTSEVLAIDNMPFIKQVYAKVDELRRAADFPKGLKLGVTGTAPVGTDLLESMRESIENTEWTTIVLVVAILLIVYRAPGLVLVPLASIAVSYFVSLNLIALVAQWSERHRDILGAIGGWVLHRPDFDFQIFKTTQIFIIVILFGAATDYCLFLIARYREELDRGLDTRAALEEALSQTGHALTASAMTTILGLGAMVLADFGKYRSGGPTIAMSLVVALAACMTIAPALLRAMGRWLLWEIRLRWVVLGLALICANYLWTSWFGAPHSFPAVLRFAVPNLAVVAGFVLLWALWAAVYWFFAAARKGAGRSDSNSGPVEISPQTAMGRFWAALARRIVAHPGLILAGSFLVMAMPAWHGIRMAITMAVPSWHGVGVPITYDMLAELSPQRESAQGMKLLEKHFLIGETGPIVVLAYRQDINFDTPEELNKIKVLAREFQDFEYVDSRGAKTRPIDHVRCLTNPLGDNLGVRLSALELSRRNAIVANPESKRQFLSSGEKLGEATRFELVTNYDPFSEESIRLLGRIDDWLKEKQTQPDWRGVKFDFTGITAQIRDLDCVNRGDTLWVSAYVAGAVLIVLLFLIRRPLISLYLIFTVVFGYLVSLGLTHLFFAWMYGDSYQGLDWKLPIFLFVILVAVGEDYNIYLVTRVFEEQRKRGRLDGLREAVTRTGGIITSCGVIMAGTFGSMATGTLRSMVELGFAMSLGVLLDTFIIRTILVPAFLALLARWGAQSAQEVRGELAAPEYNPGRADQLVRSSK